MFGTTVENAMEEKTNSKRSDAMNMQARQRVLDRFLGEDNTKGRFRDPAKEI